MTKTKTLLIVANVDWIFIAHRLEIGKTAQQKGYRVVVVAKDSGRSSEITNVGLEFHNIEMSRSGTNPIVELNTLYQLFKIYWKYKPLLVFQLTMKPIIYGTKIAKLLKFKNVNSISGLGYNFTGDRKGVVQKWMIKLMHWGFHKSNNVLIFENEDDLFELKVLNIVSSKNKTIVIKGVGVDLDKFVPTKKTNQKEKIQILLPARMLWDKGVKEFVEAANALRTSYEGKVRFVLCGMIDPGNIKMIPQEYLEQIRVENYLEWIEHQQNMVKVYQESDIVVLPSYREGLPTVLMEASACGLPLVTTDAIGCKECVEEGINGFKVPVKSVKELARAMEKLILSADLRAVMGVASRQKALKEFDQTEVVQKHLSIFNELMNG